MSEKLAEVYNKYDIEIISTRRGRGATILTTTNGLYILEPFRGSVTRLEQEHVLKGLFLKEGFCDIDEIILNKEGELLTCDRYHQPFVLKKYFEGEECDMHNLSDVIRTVKKLAEFHYCGKKVAFCYQEEWERVKSEKEQRQINEMKQMIEEGEEVEHIARLYGITPATVREILREKECKVDNGNQFSDDSMNRTVEIIRKQDDNVLKDFVRRNKELRKIYKFVSTVKRKNRFENLFLQVYSEYYKKGVHCEEVFEEVMSAMGSADALSKHYGICHGNYNQHNVILGNDSEAIVHFERFSKGNQLEDLYQFARKAMEKNHFDYEMLSMILDTYTEKIELSTEDYRYMYVLFSYPEKFWKIANSYYNTNKAFLSPKYEEKLKTLIEQEKEKSEMLSQYYAFHLK